MGFLFLHQRKIRHVEMGVKSKQAVRGIGVHRGDKFGDGPYLLFIDVAGDKERAGNQKGRNGPLADLPPGPSEILHGPLVCNAGERPVEVLIACLQVEFYASP